ncbi:hypothetical protein E3N88_10050 [Mikania micrantha]|uniref:Uncharacterized protein n=1 Tax=Mikania micrantha TaxID=192012 RepID=A0A5N6PAP9_9ASTR|nr:hypothetical protein E3N88_10050 [Mikania micrantha]
MFVFEGIFDEIEESLKCSGPEFALRRYWMQMLQTGILIANAFGVICITNNASATLSRYGRHLNIISHIMLYQLYEQTVMSDLRGETSVGENEMDDGPLDETTKGMNDPDWEMWEEWMGWEGAGIRDYSSHINPYI